MIAKKRQFVTITILFGLLLVSFGALADYKRDYDDALKAIDDEKWQQAVDQLRKVTTEEPQSAQRVRLYGMRFVPYLPHYHLGQAYYQLGDCESALGAWAEARNQGVVQQYTQEYQDLQSGEAGCAAQQPQVDIAARVAEASQALERLDSEIQQLRSLSNNPIFTSDWRNTPWNKTLRDAEALSGNLQSMISQPESSIDVEALDNLASSAQTAAVNTRNAAEAAGARLATLQRQQVEQQRAAERNKVQTDWIQALYAIRTFEDEAAPDRETETLRGELVALADQGRRQLSDNTPLEDYRRMTRLLVTQTRAYRRALQNYNNKQREIALRKPPEALLKVAQAYFSGDYDEVARIATPDRFGDKRAKIQAHLFRAAAQYHLYLLDEQQQSSLLDLAQTDIRMIKQLDRSFSPYLDAFSPKFMNLFEKTL